MPDRLEISRPSVMSDSSMSTRHRHSCERCKIKKRKCNRTQPCAACRAEDEQCVYTDNKRERLARDIAASQSKNEVLEHQVKRLIQDRGELLATLRSFSGANSNNAQLVALVDKYARSGPFDEDTGVSGDRSGSADNASQSNIVWGEETAPLSIGSPHSQGSTSWPVSLGRGAGASGMIGKMSEISWLKRAHENFSQRSVARPSEFLGLDAESEANTPKINYHIDETNVLSVDEDYVNEAQWPDMATTMVGVFLDAFHPTFPFLNKEEFLQEFSRIRQQDLGHLIGRRRQWFAMANMVFCLGAKWLFRGGSTDHAGRDDHLLYYARARKLGLDHRVVFDHPTVDQVQMLGLLGLYLVLNHQITRAWTTIGAAIRHAVALGMHLRLENSPQPRYEQKSRARTWHALCNLEVYLVEVTGRPTCLMSDLEITAPMEDLLEDAAPGLVESPTSQAPSILDTTFSNTAFSNTTATSSGQSLSNYFQCRVQISMVCRRLSVSLYAAGLGGSWSEFQHLVHSYDEQIRALSSTLPKHESLSSGAVSDRQAIELAMSIQGVRMILYRPFMCDWEGKIDNESTQSQDFNQAQARAAISAALAVVDLLPEGDDREKLTWLFPMWSTLHHLCQAGAILVLELSLQAVHMPSERSLVINSLYRLQEGLKVLSHRSLSARQAYNIFGRFLAAIDTQSPAAASSQF